MFFIWPNIRQVGRNFRPNISADFAENFGRIFGFGRTLIPTYIKPIHHNNLNTYLYFWYIIHLLSWPFPPNDVGQRVTRGLTNDTAFRVVDGESLVEELLDLGPDDDVQVGFSLDTAGSVFGDTSIHAFVLSSQLVGNQITRVFIQYPPSTESRGIR